MSYAKKRVRKRLGHSRVSIENFKIIAYYNRIKIYQPQNDIIKFYYNFKIFWVIMNIILFMYCLHMNILSISKPYIIISAH